MTDFKDKICNTLQELQESASRNTTEKVNQILHVSSHYLSETNHEKLKMFHDLYFSNNQATTDSKDEINENVDDIFAQAKEMADSGASESEINNNLKVDETAERSRMQLAGLQKKLESLLSFEDNIKEKLAPVMCSMQFEDAARQRIEHIVQMFSKVVHTEDWKDQSKVQAVAESLSENIAMEGERESFYTHVMHEETPDHVESDGDDFFFDLGA